MLGPAYAIGNQLDCRRIYRMNHPLEAPWQTRVPVAHTELRMRLFNVGQHVPKEILGHIGIADTVCM